MESILDAIKSENEAVIKSVLGKLKNPSENLLNILLENSPSKKISDFIKKTFNEKISEMEADDTTNDKENAEEINQNEGKKDISEDSESDTIYEDITEEEAVKKYTKQNNKVDKAVQMFMGAFKHNIKSINYDKATRLGYEIANHIYESYLNSFPKIVRSKVHNLKENEKLCRQIYSGNIPAVRFVEMSAVDMMSDELRSKDEETLRDSLLSSQVAQAVAETEIFQCSRCKERKCTYYQLQTRSCDEPMTTFVTCTVCGHRWRF